MKQDRGPSPLFVFGALTVLAAFAVWAIYATRFWEYVAFFVHVFILGKSV